VRPNSTLQPQQDRAHCSLPPFSVLGVPCKGAHSGRAGMESPFTQVCQPCGPTGFARSNPQQQLGWADVSSHSTMCPRGLGESQGVLLSPLMIYYSCCPSRRNFGQRDTLHLPTGWGESGAAHTVPRWGGQKGLLYATQPGQAPQGAIPAAGTDPAPAGLCKIKPWFFSARQTWSKSPQRTLHSDCSDLTPAPSAVFKVQGSGVPTCLLRTAARSHSSLPAYLLEQGLWGRDLDCSMRLLFETVVLCLTLGFGQCSEETTQENTVHQAPRAESSYSDWGIEAIRDSFETVNSYFDSFLELLGGKNGVCQYRCRYGK